ncbi:TPA: hypothetical protein N0F65_009987 [Lagenidium giganteum]|uniref:Uncharacterized protein n=1 Tax=Lagenidium giganteum TaxID=4803 RepID=A0AAV2ZAD8_9STRA|nr:TPA: hypothetical protein N0F65_009987 [Lagenidium giganteum]
MASSYEAWAKFNVDEELERVDERALREEEARQQQKQRQAKCSTEDSISKTAAQSADVLEAHAAVAALKAKANVRRRGRNDTATATNAAVGNGKDNEAAAVELRQLSAVLKHKHDLLQQILSSRRAADSLLLKEENDVTHFHEANKQYEIALQAVKELDRRAPEIEKAEARMRLLGNNQHTHENVDGAATQHTHADHAHCADAKSGHCPHGENAPSSECCHGAGTCCGDKSSDATKTTTQKTLTLPKPTDLAGVIKMFYIDVYVGIGRCAMQERRLAAAAEAFKEVLIRDETNIAAWRQRGLAFQCMGAPLLAMLHFGRVTSLIQICCYLNAASSYLEMQRPGSKAISHCKRVLEINPDHIIGHVRMSQLLRLMFRFEESLQHLDAASKLFHGKTELCSLSDRQEAANKIALERDRCQFERSQYDAAYIRSQSSV